VAALVAAEPGKTSGSAQFPELGLLLLRDFEGFAIQFFGDPGTLLPRQHLTFEPVQVRFEPPFSRPFNDLQSIVQQGYGLFRLPGDLTSRGKEANVMRQQQLRASGAKSVLTAPQERYTAGHVAGIHLDPPVIDRSWRTPVRETLLRCQCNQL